MRVLQTTAVLRLLAMPAVLCVGGLAAGLAVPASAAGWSLDIEGGIADSGYNDVAVPGDTGTRFSLTDDLATAANRFWRVRIGYDLGERGHLSALFAPLRFTARGEVPHEIRFEDRVFTAGTLLEAQYRFDSYRVTYRHDLYTREKVRAGLGLTAKIRDAEIRLEGQDIETSTTNTGFVPLIHFHLDWTPRPLWHFFLEGDALAGPQGRAEDFFIGAAYQVKPAVLLKGGYRLLEGGADVDSVYNFTLIHYLALGVVLTL
jgi:hypothetical protein